MRTLFSAIFTLCVMTILAQTSREIQYGAYLTSSKTMWEKAAELAKKEDGQHSIETCLAMYGLLNNTMAKRDEETFEQYEDATVDLLKKLIKDQPDLGEPKAILSAVYGLSMAYSPMKGMIYGMKSSSLMEDAMKQQPESPLVQRLFANSKLYTPEMWGGDPAAAVKSFKKAIQLFEKQGQTESNWQYLDAMMGLAMSLKKTQQKAEAEQILVDAISLEPQFYWAKSTLKKLRE